MTVIITDGALSDVVISYNLCHEYSAGPDYGVGVFDYSVKSLFSRHACMYVGTIRVIKGIVSNQKK